jgi:DNA-binding transcriptional ArsR family regulator
MRAVNYSSRMPRARKETTVTIEDPQALRALAHPARQRVLEELYVGEVLTATQAARLCGLTPSAMSYHLRALEKWGVVTREEPTGDGRERPWRAAADHLNVGPQALRSAGSGPSTAYVDLIVDRIREGAARAVAAVDEGDEGSTLYHARLWLTPAEARELGDEVRRLTERFTRKRAADRPEGAIARDAYWVLVPTTPGS